MQIRGQHITLHAIGLATLASMGGFLFGYDTGQISGIVIMTDFKRRFANCPAGTSLEDCTFNVWKEGTIVALLSIGTLVGALIGAPISDRTGRRKAMTIECVIFSLGVIIQVAAFYEWRQVAIGRFVSGIGVGALSAVVPLYQSETAPKAIRGSLVGTYQLAITLGILVAACFNLGTNQLTPSSASWRLPIVLGIPFALILGIGILFMPESPRWLEAHNYPEKAERSVRVLHGTKQERDIRAGTQIYHEIKNGVAQERKRGKASWFDCFKKPNKTLYRTLLGMTLQAGQQLTGANYFFYYGATIFQSLGLVNPFSSQIILNGVNVICTFGGLYIMERYGRRWPLMIGGLWCSAWLFVFASVGVANDPATNRTSGQVMIVSACMFILGYATTWAPGIWILIGETFPTFTRAKQGALSTSSNWMWNFLIAFFTQPISNEIGYAYGYIFAGCNLANAVIVYFFLYDSAGLPLEQIDVMYNDPSIKPWQSGSWVPKGYTSRYDAGDNDSVNDDQATVVGDAPTRTSYGKEKNEKMGNGFRTQESRIENA